MSGIRCVIERNQSVLSQEITVKRNMKKRREKETLIKKKFIKVFISSSLSFNKKTRFFNYEYTTLFVQLILYFVVFQLSQL